MLVAAGLHTCVDIKMPLAGDLLGFDVSHLLVGRGLKTRVPQSQGRFMIGVPL